MVKSEGHAQIEFVLKILKTAIIGIEVIKSNIYKSFKLRTKERV